MTEPLPYSADQFFDQRAETEIFARVYLPYFLSAYQHGIDNVLLGRARRKGFSEFVRERLRRKSLEHAALAVATTKKKLQEVLMETLDEGGGVQELARGIRNVFAISSKVRSLRIARTELTDVINDGSNETLRSEGYPQKEWSTVIDGAERPTHHNANGQTVGVNEFFRVGSEAARYPGDATLTPGERISCRCLIVGAGLSEDRKRQVGRRFLRVHGALERRFVVSLRRAFDAQRDRILTQFPAPDANS